MKTKVSELAFIIFVAVLLSVVISEYRVKNALDEMSNASVEGRHFKVIDIKLLSDQILMQLQASVAGSNEVLSPELLEVMAQNEARKMFNTIAHSAGENDIILSKNSIVYTPARFDITEEIAAKLGFSSVRSTTLKEKMNVEDQANEVSRGNN